MKKKIYLLITIIIMLCAEMFFHNISAQAASVVQIQDDLWVGADGNIYFQTHDHRASSSIRYATIGFTVTKCELGTKNAIEEIYIPIALGDYEETKAGNYVTTVFKISKGDIISKISAKDPTWLSDINSGQKCYIKFDAIMITIENNVASGMIDASGNYYVNSASKKPGIYDKTSIDQLKTAYGWSDTSSIDTHFNKYLLFNGEPTIPGGGSGTTTGKIDAYVKTGNTSSLYDLSLGIPTSEDVTNKIIADRWYGNANITEKTLIKEYDFPYTLKWQEWYDYVHYDPDTGWTGDWVDRESTVTITVEKEATFRYITGLNIYSLVSIDVYNAVFPNEHISYGGVDVPISYGINGNYNPADVTDWNYIEEQHVDWGLYTGGTVEIDVGRGGSYDSAYALAEEDANDPDKAGLEKTFARNDSLQIDGTVYMDGNWTELNEANEYKTPDWIGFPSKDSFPHYTAEQTVTIPDWVANDIYVTQLKATYKKIAVSGEPVRQFVDSILPDNVIKEYEKNEPIRVHTPVISPVIVDGEDETQLIITPSDDYIDGQLKLDGTYNFHWDDAIHRYIMGYGDSGDPSKYNKYVKKKEMMFPFDVVYQNHVVPANTWFTVGKADWVNTPIYIPSWAEEMAGNVQYKVTAENAYDESGQQIMDRIEKQENIANVQIKVDGSGENYVATYSMPVQTSGIIYGFEIDGVNTKDIFNKDYSTNIGDLTSISLANEKTELKVGTKNRLGLNTLRYTMDGKTTSWNKENTLPLGVNKDDIATGIDKGVQFSFQVRTIANLGDSEDDAVCILPTYRYVAADGTVYNMDDIDIYYHDTNQYFVKYGSQQDISNLKIVSLADSQFESSVYDYGEGYRTDYFHTQELTYTVNVDDTQELQSNLISEYLNRDISSYTVSGVKMSHKLRVLTGNYGQLQMAADGEGNLARDDGYYKELTGVGGEASIGSYYGKFMSSMQTWHGQYKIPDQLFVCAKDTDLVDYALNNELNEQSDIWFKDGYLVLNFYIFSVNDGDNHLQYFSRQNAFAAENMWMTEGGRQTVSVNENQIELLPGDVAIIDMNQSVSDRYTTGIYMIN